MKIIENNIKRYGKDAQRVEEKEDGNIEVFYPNNTGVITFSIDVEKYAYLAMQCIFNNLVNTGVVTVSFTPCDKDGNVLLTSAILTLTSTIDTDNIKAIGIDIKIYKYLKVSVSNATTLGKNSLIYIMGYIQT